MQMAWGRKVEKDARNNKTRREGRLSDGLKQQIVIGMGQNRLQLLLIGSAPEGDEAGEGGSSRTEKSQC